MKIICRLILLTGFLVLVACTGSKPQPTPTPFVPTGTPPAGRQVGALLDVSLSELAAAPANFDGAQLRLTGRYRPLPSLFCSTRRYQSPATWGLADGELLARMNGFDAQLRRLLPPNLTMTVIGTWQQWQGPVGCGKQAATQQIWFLNVTEIVSPNPLTMVTLTPAPDGEQTEVAGVTPTPAPDEADAAPPTAVPPTGAGEPTPTAEEQGTIPAQSPTPTSTTRATAVSPTPTNDDDPDDGAGNAITGTPSATTSPTPGSGGTATPTPSPGGGGNGGGGATATTPPLATATPTGSEVEMDVLTTFFPSFGELGQNEIHVWTFDVFAGDTFTVSVAAQPNLDVTLSLNGPDGQPIILNQNNASAGQVEIIAGQETDVNGAYELRVRTTNGAPGHYTAVLSDNSFPIRSRSIMTYGETNNVSLLAEIDDLWYFFGESGDSVTIAVDPAGSQDDFLILLSGPSSAGYLADVDDTGAGQSEQLSSFTLPEDGMYVIQVGELDFAPAAYQIRLTQN